jgi:hypothetical protein
VCKGNLCRGFSAVLPRHKSDLRFTRKFRDLIAKLPGLSSSFGQERAGRERRPSPAKSPATRRPRSAGETLNGERRTRGSRIRAHRRRGWTGVAGFRRGGGGPPWWPAGALGGDGVPVDSGRWEASRRLHFGEVDMMVASIGSRGRQRR